MKDTMHAFPNFGCVNFSYCLKYKMCSTACSEVEDTVSSTSFN